MPTAALRTSREAARAALREPGPFALALPLVGDPTRLARSLLRATAGLLQHGAVVAPDGVWTLRPTEAGSVLVTPLLAGAAGLGRLQQVVRALRADGAALAEAPVSVFLDAPLDPQKLGYLQALCARQLPLVQPAPTVPSLPPPRRIDASRKRLERSAAGSRWLAFVGEEPLGPPLAGLDVRPLLTHGFVAIGLDAHALHSGEVTALVQIAAGLLHRAQVARSVARTPRPTSADSARYDLRVALLYLGFIGADFRTQREQLLQRVTGSAAWKHGAPRKPA